MWLDLDGAVLMIERTEASLHRIDGIGAGPFLFALRAPDPAHRREIETRLERGGVSIEEHTQHTSYFRDPEGNRVAVSTYPLAAEWERRLNDRGS